MNLTIKFALDDAKLEPIPIIACEGWTVKKLKEYICEKIGLKPEDHRMR